MFEYSNAFCGSAMSVAQGRLHIALSLKFSSTNICIANYLLLLPILYRILFPLHFFLPFLRSFFIILFASIIFFFYALFLFSFLRPLKCLYSSPFVPYSCIYQKLKQNRTSSVISFVFVQPNVAINESIPLLRNRKILSFCGQLENIGRLICPCSKILGRVTTDHYPQLSDVSQTMQMRKRSEIQ